MKRNRLKESIKSAESNKNTNCFSIFENAPDAVLIYDIDGRIINGNNKAREYLGYLNDELRTKKIIDIDNSYRGSKEFQHDLGKLSNNKPITLKRTYKTKNGGTIPVEVHLSYHVINNKQVVLSYVRDITELSRAHNELQQSHQLLETSEILANIGSLKLNPKTRHVTYSANALKIHGINPAFFDGKADSLFKVFHPDDIKNYKLSLEEILSEKKPHVLRYRIIRPDGEVRIIKGTTQLNINNKGNIESLIVHIQDITESIKQEEIVTARLRLIEFAGDNSVKNVLQKFLDEAELLTGSKIGFYHFLEEDQETLSLQAWSTNTLKNMCQAKGEGMHYPVSKAGIWVDCIHTKKPVVHNNYKSIAHKKGLPKGHAPITREMVVPVFRNKKIVSILGVGNKPINYNKQDVKIIKDLAELAWDMIERNKAEEKAFKLSKAVEQSPESIVITDKEGVIEYVNPKFVELTGFNPNETIGNVPNILNTNCIPQDPLTSGDIWKTIKSGNIWQGEFHNKKKNNQDYWENVRIAPLKNNHDEISNYVIIKEDISEKKKILSDFKEAKENAETNEVKLKEAQRIAKIGNWELDILSNKLLWSDEIYRIFDCKPNEFKATYEAFLNFIHPDDRNLVNEAYTKHLLTKTPYNIVHRILLPKNKVKYVRERCETEFDNNGNPIRSMGTVSDITESVQVQNELRIAKEKAEESDRLKSAFLNNMSHEIRTPMNGIIGFSEMLTKPELTVEQRTEYGKVITQSSNQLLNIVNDILDIAKIESGLVMMKEEKTDLTNICQEVLNLHKFDVSNKNIELKTCQKTDCALGYAVIDKAKVIQILSNLINNAIKFTNEGTVQLKCAIKNGMIEFSVSDTGIGIDKNIHSAIFDRFRQAELTATRNYGGTGLGLSICKGLTELMNGKLWLKSKPGKGSTFYFAIPFKPAQPQANTSSSKPVNNIDYSKYTVLVVEDEEINYKYIYEILRNLSINLIRAKNGKEAITLFQDNKDINLVLMDIKMPVMNGYDATKEIKKMNDKVPVIACSAHAFYEDKEKAFTSGCDDYLAKPVREQKLKDTIDKHLIKVNTLTRAV